MSVIPKTSDQVDQWRSVMFLYDSALKKLNTKIEILNNEFVNRYDHNPIEHIKSRLKTADSIVKKAEKRRMRSDHRQYDEPFKRYCRYPHYLFFYF